MAEVIFENVTKIYDTKKIINNVSLKIKDKEFVVLVGASGCGKSTLLRMVAGLESVTQGSIFIDGKCVNNLPPKDRDIAMVFQNYALYPHLNVYDNMAFPLKMRGQNKKEINEKILEAANILGLEEYLKRKPKELSGGQRQRVALGRAIVRQPKVFLMDEPLSNLDAKLRVQMRSEIKKLHQRLQTTFVYVTHDQTEALTMGDNIVVLDNGIIQQIGSPEQIYNNPENIFVGGFLGSPAMNFFDANITNQKTLINDIEVHIPINDGKVKIGIRPEKFSTTANISIPIKIEMVEMLGSEKIIYFNLNNSKCCAKLTAGTIINDIMQISFSVEDLHFFNFETGQKLPIS